MGKNDFDHHVSSVGVFRSNGEYGLFSTELIPPGERVFTVDGELAPVPSIHSVQVDRAVHVDIPHGYGPAEILDRFYWRFVNHSCDPNVVIRGRNAFALKTIKPFREVTFHYNTTEYEMAEPFACRCGSAHCEGTIRGFRFLSRADQERLRPWLANHLLKLMINDSMMMAGYREEEAMH